MYCLIGHCAAVSSMRICSVRAGDLIGRLHPVGAGSNGKCIRHIRNIIIVKGACFRCSRNVAVAATTLFLESVGHYHLGNGGIPTHFGIEGSSSAGNVQDALGVDFVDIPRIDCIGSHGHADTEHDHQNDRQKMFHVAFHK